MLQIRLAAELDRQTVKLIRSRLEDFRRERVKRLNKLVPYESGTVLRTDIDDARKRKRLTCRDKRDSFQSGLQTVLSSHSRNTVPTFVPQGNGKGNGVLVIK
jgi:hypothetical protein